MYVATYVEMMKIKKSGPLRVLMKDSKRRHRWIHCASSLNQKRNHNKFKNKIQQEVPDN